MLQLDCVVLLRSYMRTILLICAFFGMSYSACAGNFFDYSDEEAMISRFRDFENRKISSIRRLENWGVFLRKIDKENLIQAKQLSVSLWRCILQESLPHKVEFDDSDETLLYKQFWQFRTHYQSDIGVENINNDVKNYLILFSRIEGTIYR